MMFTAKVAWWLAFDLVGGLFLAGGLAAVVVALVPGEWRGSWLVWLVAVPSVVGFGLLRRALVRVNPGRQA